MAFCLLAIVEESLSGLLSYLFWSLAICFLFGYIFRPRLVVQTGMLELFHVGERVNVPLTITNTGRLPAYDVYLSLAGDRNNYVPLAELHKLETLTPGQSVKIYLPLQAKQRGCHQAPDLLATSYFPLAIFSFNRSYRLGCEVAVAPAIKSDDVLGDLVARESLISGPASQNAQGLFPFHTAVSVDMGYEYVGSREYQSGLAVRRWDFSSWARMGRPAVREFSDSSETVVVVVVECLRRGKANRQDAVLEETLSLAASGLSQLFAMGKSVRLFTIEDCVTETESFTSQPHECMRQLAEVVGSREQIDWLDAVEDIREQLHTQCQVYDSVGVEWIVFLGVYSEAAKQALENLSEHGETASVFIATAKHAIDRESAPANAERAP